MAQKDVYFGPGIMDADLGALLHIGVETEPVGPHGPHDCLFVVRVKTDGSRGALALLHGRPTWCGPVVVADVLYTALLEDLLTHDDLQ